MDKPTVKRPNFTEAEMPCYDYRNMENAGKYRGVGQAGKVGLMNGSSIDAMPPTKTINKVPRDHNG